MAKEGTMARLPRARRCAGRQAIRSDRNSMPRGSTALFVVAMLLVARAAAADDTAFRPPMLLPGDSLVANTPVAIERAAPHVPPPCEALPIVPQRHSGAPKASTAVQDGSGPDGTSAAAGEGGTSNAPGAEVSAVSATEEIGRASCRERV